MSWINFRELREALSFEQVLDHYRVQLKIAGGKATGFCPLPSHQGEKRSPSFSVQLEKGLFQCFGCRAKGNVLDFACLMEGKNPRAGADIHEVAQKLQKQFLGGNGDSNSRPQPRRDPPREQRQSSAPRTSPPPAQPTKPSLPVIVNAPLNFQLKELDPIHPYLKERGFTPETINHFGLGFCNRGAFKGRVVIPLHDAAAQFIGYAGRITDDKLISKDCPKYKFPSPREHEGAIHELHKTLFLYNGHQIKEPVDDLIVVEGFPSVWWLWQNSLPNVVALMGSSCSPEQAKLIVDQTKPEGRIWICTDGDDGGDACARDILCQVSPHRLIRRFVLFEKQQPTDCTGEELVTMFPFGAIKSGTSKKPRVARPRKKSDVKPSESMAAEE